MSVMKQFRDGDLCEHVDCDEAAIGVVCSSYDGIRRMCQKHHDECERKEVPEYTHACGNCGAVNFVG